MKKFISLILILFSISLQAHEKVEYCVPEHLQQKAVEEQELVYEVEVDESQPAKSPEDTHENESGKVVWAVGMKMGFKTLDVEREFDQGALTFGAFRTNPMHRTVEFSENFATVDLSLTAAWANYYATLNYETNVDTEEGIIELNNIEFAPAGQVRTDRETKMDLDRDDWAFTFGWNLRPRWTLFTGYKSGTTNADRYVPTVENFQAREVGKIESEFTEAGPFVGAAYAMPVGHGYLSFSAAYARMAGEYEETGSELIFFSPVFGVTQNALEYDGDTDAIGLAINWNVPVTDHWSYYLGVKHQRYSFDADTDVTWNLVFPFARIRVPLTGKGEVDNSETTTGFYGGINYQF
jgi:hypothetical protein